MENRRVFLSYSQSNPRRNVLSVMEVPEGKFAADPSSERVLMEIPHQLADHFSVVGVGEGAVGGFAENIDRRITYVLSHDLAAFRNELIPVVKAITTQPRAEAEFRAKGLGEAV